MSIISFPKLFNQEIPYPDISTKAKAQEFIGLDMDKHNDEKKIFLDMQGFGIRNRRGGTECQAV